MIAKRGQAALLASLLAACSHTPSKPPPLISVQAEWETHGLAEAEPMPVKWWASFDDPSLDGLVDEALRRGIDIRIAAERVLEAQAVRQRAAGDLAPEFDLRGNVEFRGGHGVGNEADAGSLEFGAAWEPDLSGRLGAAVRAARANEVATAADARATRLLLIGEVIAAYIQVRLQQALIALTERSVSAQEATLRITRDRFEFGLASQLDVQRTAALVAATRAELATARENADAARFRLVYLLSTEPEDIAARLGEAGSIPVADPQVVLYSPINVIAARPDVHAAEARYAVAAARRDMASALRLPTVTLTGLVGLDNDRLGELLESGSGITSLAASLFSPLLDFGRRSSEIHAADARLRVAALQYERIARLALRETQTAIVSYLQGEIRERELRRATDAARHAANLSRLQYREGTLSQLEVLDAARTAYQAERDHALAQAQVATRLADLYRVMGVAPD